MYTPYQITKTALLRLSKSARQIVAPASALLLPLLLGTGCVSDKPAQIPPGVSVLNSIETKHLAGTWYEVARLNHFSERGLTRESVTFKPRTFGRWLVIHRGWRNSSGAWEEVALEAQPPTPMLHSASLRGRFTSLIPSDIHVVAIDKTFKCILVCGTNQHEFWILTREQNPPKELVLQMLNEARAKGFPVEEALFLQFQ